MGAHVSATLERTRVDWRGSIVSNKRKTTFVILLFLFIYSVFGYLLDFLWWMAYHHDVYTSHTRINNILFDAFNLLSTHFLSCVNGDHTPIMVLFTQAFSLSSLLWTRFYHGKILLMDANTTEITDSTAGDKEKQLFNILHELKIASGLSYLPRLYVMESPHMNAFASGWDEKNAIIVVTRTMMDELNREELQAVLAHELSHIRHHDIKLALTVSVLSNIMLLIAHYLFRESFQNSNSQGTRKKHNHPIIWCVIFVLYIIIPFVSTLLVMLLSRTREYLADAGAIELVRDNAGLASALLKIQASHPNKNHNTDRDHGQLFDNPFERVRKPSYIYSVAQSSFGSKFLQDLLNSHPSISDRIAAIGFERSPDC